MKIVVVKSPKALSSLLRLVFGIKKPDRKLKTGSYNPLLVHILP